MNLLATLLGLSLLILAMAQAVDLHRSAVCRQRAWLSATELLTRSTLTDAPVTDSKADLPCQLRVKRMGPSISWTRAPGLRRHHFELALKGKL